MKVGYLIVDKCYPKEPGIILELGASKYKTYKVLNDKGKVQWFGKRYIELQCKVISPNSGSF